MKKSRRLVLMLLIGVVMLSSMAPAAHASGWDAVYGWVDYLYEYFW